METKKDPWTLQQKFGFQDDDLKSSKHDDIMIWLDTNIEKIIDNLVEFDRNDTEYNKDEIEKGIYVGLSISDLPKKNILTINKIWEQPIMNGHFMIGFVDLFVQASKPRRVSLDWYREKNGDEKRYWYVERETIAKLVFEVKSVLPSIGELIRQIRMYQQFCSEMTKFYIVASDDRYESILKSQNIGFIKYTG